MISFSGNVNEVYPMAVDYCRWHGEPIEARGTHTREMHPVTIELEQPWQCLVTSFGRPVNVAFAMAEVLWILSGRRDVEMLDFYSSNIKKFSDNGTTFNAAYGYRLRQAHGHDQILDVIATLQDDPTSRQAVLSMWHPNDRGWFHVMDNPDEDIQLAKRHTLDRACNVFSHLLIRNNRLDWMHFVRSNDIILGLPYNFVQFAHLQAHIARALGILPGEFVYIADSLHMYTDTYYTEEKTAGITKFDLYDQVDEPDFMLGIDDFNEVIALEKSIRDGFYLNPRLAEPEDGYWRSVAHLWAAHRWYRDRDDEKTLDQLRGAPLLYAAAQARFYWTNRWSNLVGSDKVKMVLRLEEMFGDEIASWMVA